jgi:GT2 family glycosyltransferase
MQTVGIVTVTYNSRHVIDEFMASVLSQTYTAFVLYVVDNASNDGTLAQVRSYRDQRIKVLANSINNGAAEGNNQGISIALGDGCDPILLINNDTVFGPDLLKRLLEGIEQHSCDMVASKILFHGDDNIIWSAGGGFDKNRGYASYLYGHAEFDAGQFDECRLVDNAPTTCLLVKKNVFERIGLLDPHYFAYVEDTDFCYRAKLAGLKLLYLPSARLWHKAHSLSGGLFSHFMMRYTTRNRVYFMLKHLGFRALYLLPAYQAYLLQQFVLRRVGLSMLWVREKGFFEGVKVWRKSLVDTPQT